MRCDGVLELLTHLPRFDDRPAYRIFGCPNCGFIDWIAEVVGDA
jgi:hypothetical protein